MTNIIGTRTFILANRVSKNYHFEELARNQEFLAIRLFLEENEDQLLAESVIAALPHLAHYQAIDIFEQLFNYPSINPNNDLIYKISLKAHQTASVTILELILNSPKFIELDIYFISICLNHINAFVPQSITKLLNQPMALYLSKPELESALKDLILNDNIFNIQAFLNSDIINHLSLDTIADAYTFATMENQQNSLLLFENYLDINDCVIDNLTSYQENAINIL
ncbi:MAG: hypothetical protein JHC93_03730, partial [Parachlamydiales bacterium]|nr:hypothetical protein [Parachlamydiales bacterium]